MPRTKPKRKPAPKDSGGIRDRIKELRRVKASSLIPNGKNWRVHPESQRAALQGVLAEVGYADALLARELDDGSLQLIDGHLRAETTPDAEVPVLVLDVTEAEADKILATLDPLAAMAEANSAKLDELLRSVNTGDEALAAMIADLAADAGITPKEEADTSSQLGAMEYRVVVKCADESSQSTLIARLESEGYECQPLMS